MIPQTQDWRTRVLDTSACGGFPQNFDDGYARLNADSWRRNYRGAYLDSFLDGDVLADRLAVWTDRLTQPRSNQYTIVAAESKI